MGQEIEKRTYGRLIKRAEGDKSRKIEGYAAIFNSPSEPLGSPGGFTEVIARGAFDNADLSDVRALLNHDQNIVLARTSSNTLTLSVDEIGLRYSFEAPDSPNGDNVLRSIERGDINQSSFAFFLGVDGDEWMEDENGNTKRIIRSIRSVQDVSPVTFPAYEATTATKRNLTGNKEESQLTDLEIAEAELTIIKQ